MNKTALISVYDKEGIVDFAHALVQTHGYRILSTGGTARTLREAGLEVTDVSAYTGFPEMMEGRVKTLHPKIHGGLLSRRDREDHLRQAEEARIDLIDLVVVNLYPFEDTIAVPGVTREEAIEQIDIGGPGMLRSGAKNHAAVTVVTEPGDYGEVLSALGDEAALAPLRRKLAAKVFARTSAYDQAIAAWLEESEAREGTEPDLAALGGFPGRFQIDGEKAMDLRYGENPHQKAALYGRFFDIYEQLQGKELSFNNIIDISAATWLIGEYEQPTVAILKHTNPCGVGPCLRHRPSGPLRRNHRRESDGGCRPRRPHPGNLLRGDHRPAFQ